jgi:hypothetical protein
LAWGQGAEKAYRLWKARQVADAAASFAAPPVVEGRTRGEIERQHVEAVPEHLRHRVARGGKGAAGRVGGGAEEGAEGLQDEGGAAGACRAVAEARGVRGADGDDGVTCEGGGQRGSSVSSLGLLIESSQIAVCVLTNDDTVVRNAIQGIGGRKSVC